MSPSSSNASGRGAGARAVISLGSNLGQRERNVLRGAAALASLPGIADPRLSSLYETGPVGDGYSGPFVNAVMLARAAMAPIDLLDECRAIEGRAGRIPGGGDRTLDIDILLFGSLSSSDPRLVVPHPRMLERLFVLLPLAELDPFMPLPPGGVPVGEAAARLLERRGPPVRLISSRRVVTCRP